MKFFCLTMCLWFSAMSFAQESTIPHAENNQENNLKVIAFGEKLLSSFQESDADFFYQNFNKDAFIAEVIPSEEISFPEKQRLFEQTFEKGFLKSYFDIPENIYKLVNDGASYDAVNYYYHLEEKKYHLLFRLFTGDESLDYHDYQLAFVNGDFKVQNLYSYKSAEYKSKTLQTIYEIVNTTSTDDQEKVKERQEVYDFLVRYRDISSKNSKKAFDDIRNLTGNFTNSKLYHVLKVIIASEINDVFYVEAIDELVEKFPYETGSSLFALDYYVLLKNYNAAMQIIDALANVTEDDFLEYIRGIIALQFDDYTTAEKALSHTVKEFPRFNSGFVNLIFLYDQLEKHEDTIVLLQRIIDNTEYTKTDLVNFIDESNNGLQYFPNTRIYKRWKRKK